MPLPSSLMIGTQAGGTGGMVTLDSIGIKTKSVEAVPVHYSRYLKRGDGTFIGQGYKQAEWHLNGIRDTHWSTLRSTYFTGQSTWVYIRTYNEDAKTFRSYLALAHWTQAPPVRDHDTNVVLDFSVTFEQMVEQAES